MGIAEMYTRFTLRLPDDLHHDLLQFANKNHRSLNSEIINRLKESSRNRLIPNQELEPTMDIDEQAIIAKFNSLSHKQQIFANSIIDMIIEINSEIIK